MIQLDFSIAVALYLILLFVLVFVSWLFGRRQKEKELSLDPKFIWFCSVCAYTFVNTREDTISVCPRCGSYNKKSS